LKIKPKDVFAPLFAALQVQQHFSVPLTPWQFFALTSQEQDYAQQLMRLAHLLRKKENAGKKSSKHYNQTYIRNKKKPAIAGFIFKS